MALGMAIAEKINSLGFRTYALLSDGECNEGSIWEAAMLASAQKIKNLTVIVDYNKWQATGRSNDVLAIEPLKEKWSSFGWGTQEIDGHNFSEINQSLEKAKLQDSPSAIIAHTIKGKGISFMEESYLWHNKMPNEYLFNEALEKLKQNS